MGDKKSFPKPPKQRCHVDHCKEKGSMTYKGKPCCPKHFTELTGGK